MTQKEDSSARTVAQIADSETRSCAKLAATIARSYAEQMRKASENLSRIHQTLLGGMGNMTSRGWYIGPDVFRNVPVFEFAELVRPENIEKLEQVIIAAADEQVIRITRKSSKLFPKRKHIFEELLRSFEHGFYHSVVNLGYSQADGICKEIWNEFGFFDKDSTKSYELKLYGRLKQSDLFNIASILAEQLDNKRNEITMWSGDQKLQDPAVEESTFNRHKVMHGHSLNYGTKVNAMRVFYLIDYLCFFVEQTGQPRSGQ